MPGTAGTTYGTNFPTSGRAVVDIANKISYIAPNETPFLVFSSRLGKESCHNPQFKWIESEFFVLRDIPSTGATCYSIENATSVVDQEDVFTINSMEDMRAFESLAANTDVAANAEYNIVRVTHGTDITDYVLQPTDASAWPIDFSNMRVTLKIKTLVNGEIDATDACSMQILTPALERGSVDKSFGGYIQGGTLIPETRNRTRIMDAYTQIIRTSMSITGTLQATELYGGDELARLHLRKIKQHKIDMEYVDLFAGRGSSSELGGAAPSTTSGNGVTTYATGLGVGVVGTGTGSDDDRGFIRSKNPYTTTDPTALDTNSPYHFGTYASSYATFYGDMMDACANVFETGSDTRVLLCSRSWLSAFAHGVLESTGITANWETGKSVYGVKVNRLETMHGDLLLVHEPLLRGQFEAFAVAVDFSTIKLRPMRGRDTKLRTNVQANDVDGRIDELITEIGLQVEHEEANAIFYCAGF